MIQPDFDAFAAGHASGRAQLVYTRLVADMETPVSAFLKLGGGRDNAFLLESVQGGEVRGRYSIIGIKPDLIWRCRGDLAEINRNALGNGDSFTAESAKPLEVAAGADAGDARPGAEWPAAYGDRPVRLSGL